MCSRANHAAAVGAAGSVPIASPSRAITNGQPLRHGNVRRRIWLPLLARAGLAARRPYETRHTYATLMLAAGVVLVATRI